MTEPVTMKLNTLMPVALIRRVDTYARQLGLARSATLIVLLNQALADVAVGAQQLPIFRIEGDTK